MQSLPHIDWSVARTVGRRLVPPGPAMDVRAVAGLVESLRSCAQRATGLVREVTELERAADSDVLVVDRRSWVSSTVAMAERMLGQVEPADPDPGLGVRVQGRLIGLEAGAAFAWVGTRILGQFDPFGLPARLMLVAPNIATVEQELGVNPDDFRLWVCVHEETHRFQFGQAPWLTDHLIELLRELLTGEDHAFRGWRPGKNTPVSVADLVASPAQQATFERVTAVMSLMEGHADVMMDRVGTDVIPSVPLIRRAFENRRDKGGWQAVIQKVLGLDLKRAQYREGAHFCRTVIDAVGVRGLNQVFESPGLLPSLTEIRDPQQWIHRVGPADGA